MNVAELAEHLAATTPTTPAPAPEGSHLDGDPPSLTTAEEGAFLKKFSTGVILREDSVTINLGGMTKEISYTDFLEAVNHYADKIKHLNEKKKATSKSFHLPTNTIYCEVQEKALNLILYFPEDIREISYGTTTSARKYKVKMPNTVLYIHMTEKDGEYTIAHNYPIYRCTELSINQYPRAFDTNINTRRGIRGFPFGNTYSHGGMCFGTNAMQRSFKPDQMRGIDWFYNYIFESPFNNDLSNYFLSNFNTWPKWYEELVKIAADNLPFPYDRVVGRD